MGEMPVFSETALLPKSALFKVLANKDVGFSALPSGFPGSTSQQLMHRKHEHQMLL